MDPTHLQEAQVVRAGAAVAQRRDELGLRPCLGREQLALPPSLGGSTDGRIVQSLDKGGVVPGQGQGRAGDHSGG